MLSQRSCVSSSVRLATVSRVNRRNKTNKWIFQSTCETDSCEVNSFEDFIEFWFVDDEVFEDIADFLSSQLKPRKFTHTLVGDPEDGYNSDFIVYEYGGIND